MRLILTILLIGLFKADAQMVINASAPYRPLGAFVCPDLLLDCHPNAAAAYSLRKLRAGYTGSAIRVRKDTTGQPEQDIGFTANGDLDTVAMKSFLNARSGFIVTWYSQGDSTSVNFSQSAQASQPRIALNGVIDRRLGEPSLFFDGTDDFMDVESSTVKFNFLHRAGTASAFYVIQPGTVSDPNSSYVIIDNNSTASVNIGYCIFFDDRVSVSRNETMICIVTRGVSAQPTSSTASANLFCIANQFNLYTNLIHNSTASAADRNTLRRNGANAQAPNTFTNTASTSNASFNMRLGRRANATDFNFNGYMSEIVLYPTNTVNRTGIETNINSYYGIY